MLIARNGFGDLFLRTVEGKVICLNVGGGTQAEAAESESSFKESSIKIAFAKNIMPIRLALLDNDSSA